MPCCSFLSGWTCLVKNELLDSGSRFQNGLKVLISCLRGDLPSATLMSCFFTDDTGGYPGGVWDSSLLYVTARPATKAPVTVLLRTGSSLHGGPQCVNNSQPRTYRNLCCTWYDAYVPLRHLTDCQDGAANGAGPSECTAGVTPAPSENLGQDD